MQNLVSIGQSLGLSLAVKTFIKRHIIRINELKALCMHAPFFSSNADRIA